MVTLKYLGAPVANHNFGKNFYHTVQNRLGPTFFGLLSKTFKRDDSIYRVLLT